VNRREEIGELLRMKPDEVKKRADSRLVVCEDLYALHRRMAEDIAAEIRMSSEQNKPLRLILPVGPTGQYPLLADLIVLEEISLANCWFFFMDEYCDESGKELSPAHPLSFRGEAQRLFLGRLSADNGLKSERVIFPGQDNIQQLPHLIEEIGGIDTCYGGIGIHGHIAFNEPEPGVRDMGSRRVQLNDFTVTMNAIRAHVGGNLEGFPRGAFTLGMSEILAARHIRLYCRNGCEFDWANTVLRVALFGTPGDDYPVTHIRDKDYTIITDKDTLAAPPIIL
jgi:glucosamine-6-phosphate deaminase